MRRWLKAIVILLLTGWGLMPLANSIARERAGLKYGGAHVNRQMRLNIGQGMAIGLLAGFRGIVADFVWISSHEAWEKQEWQRQYRHIEVATTLQPQSVMFWDLGAWNMAWNIGYAVRVDTNNPTQSVGLKREREWHERARQFLLRGIENIPNRYDLYYSLGWLYEQKFNDHCRAAEMLEKACQFKDTPPYIERLYARSLERCGMPYESYQAWRHIWVEEQGMVKHPWSVVEHEIKHLEDQLDIPADQRIFPKPVTTP